MKPKDDDDVETAANAIQEYLRLHLHAADTLDGVLAGWLPWLDQSRFRVIGERYSIGPLERKFLDTRQTESGTVIFKRKREH